MIEHHPDKGELTWEELKKLIGKMTKKERQRHVMISTGMKIKIARYLNEIPRTSEESIIYLHH